MEPGSQTGIRADMRGDAGVSAHYWSPVMEKRPLPFQAQNFRVGAHCMAPELGMSQGREECNRRLRLCTPAADGAFLTRQALCSRLEGDRVLLPEFFISPPGKELAGSVRRSLVVTRTPGGTRQRVRSRSRKRLSGR